MMTESKLKKYLYYDPETGIFTRKIGGCGYKKGDIAGCVHHTGYVYIRINTKKYPAHHLAWLYMTGEFPKSEIDHKDSIKNNNKFNNLREVTKLINLKNKRLYKNNSSGVVGVFWNKKIKNGMPQYALTV